MDTDRPYNMHDVVKRSGRAYTIVSRLRKRLGVGLQLPSGEWRFTVAEADQLGTVGKRPPKPPPPRPAYSLGAIARLLGIQRVTVGHWCDHLGIAHQRGMKVPATQLSRLQALRDAGGIGRGQQPAHWRQHWGHEDTPPVREEYVTIMVAARLTGRPRSSIQGLANRGHVRTMLNPDAPNPRRGRRLVHRHDVLAWFDPAEAGQPLSNGRRHVSRNH